MRRIHRVIASLVIVALAVAPAPALAQYTNSYGYSFNNPVSATANQFFWDGMNRRLLLRVMLKKRGYTDAQLGQMTTDQMRAVIEGGQARPASDASATTPTPAPTPTAAPAKPAKRYPTATRFKPAKKRLAVGTIVDSLVQDRAQRKAMVELFDGAIKAYEVEAKKIGFANDLAGAMAFFIAAAYLVHHDGQEPDEQGVELLAIGLREQMATADVAKISSADKQKFYELMLVLGTFLMVSRQQAANDNDTATLASLKTAAGDALKGFLKLEPTAFTITANGLELTAK